MLTNNEHKTFQDIPLSVLDLAPIVQGSDAKQAFQDSVRLAQHVEKLGFNRYWLAEHHNMQGIGSSATSVLIGHIAGHTNHMRIGSGGVMLPNHATLVIAEQFGTLESLYPGRIDLGLGRAPGSDQATAYALRRTLHAGPDEFPMQVNELQDYFSNDPVSQVKAVPGKGLDIPIWLLGSSDFSARLAAEKGLPFSFASHFAPQYTVPALQLYRRNFQPSNILDKPYAMVGINVIAADTDEEAEYLANSHRIQFLNLRRGKESKLQPPVENMDTIWSPMEKAAVEESLDPRTTIIGSKETIKKGIEAFRKETEADEMIITSQIYDMKARLRSYEIIGEIMD
ncbi:LLM class flavin-dependent oxidoreductase [Oceanobacillus sp. 1P07AA]|uniref:LLM class flavin-dependent oxidoreductase n=1 Tax=Oceanobacillus sp. 1P07AA TaxID=3132293 RepID=UPI0039A6960F